MTDRNSAEQAYCFFHQKWRVYSGSHSEAQKDDIEYAICSYVNCMDSGLRDIISGGEPSFLREHVSFERDIARALALLEKELEG